MILIFAFRDGSLTRPTCPAPFTELLSGAGNNCAMSRGYRIATSSGETSGAWTNATQLVCLVYRPDANCTLGIGSGSSVFGSTSGGTSNTVSVGNAGFTIERTDGTSIIVAAVGHMSTDQSLSIHPPSDFASRVDQLDVVAELCAFDAAGLTTWAPHSMSLSGTLAGWRTALVEIVSNVITVQNLDLGMTAPGAVTVRCGPTKRLSATGSSLVSAGRSASRRLSAAGSAALSIGRRASKGLTASGSGAVAQVLQQWQKLLAIATPATVAFGQRQIAKKPLITTESTVGRLGAITIGRTLSGHADPSLTSRADKQVATLNSSLVAAGTAVGKIAAIAASSVASIHAVKVKVIELFATSVGMVVAIRQSMKLLATSSTSTVRIARTIERLSAVTSGSLVTIGRSISSRLSVLAPSQMSSGRQVGRILGAVAASAATTTSTAAHVLMLAIAAPAALALRRAMDRIMAVTASSVLSIIDAAVTKLTVAFSTSSSITAFRRSNLVRTISTNAVMVLIRRAIARTVIVPAGAVITVQRFMDRTLTVPSLARISVSLASTIKDVVNRYLRVVGRMTKYIISGKSDVLVRGQSAASILGSTAMNVHEPLDFICGMDWQLGGPQLNADGTPLGLSGATIQWKLDSVDGGTNFVTLTDGNGISVDLAASSVSIDVPAAETAALSPGTYRDYLIVTLQTGPKIPMWTGIIRAGAQPA